MLRTRRLVDRELAFGADWSHHAQKRSRKNTQVELMRASWWNGSQQTSRKDLVVPAVCGGEYVLNREERTLLT